MILKSDALNLGNASSVLGQALSGLETHTHTSLEYNHQVTLRLIELAL